MTDYTLHLGDCLEVMATLPAGSVDAIVTDPPYGLKFMGRSWDHGVPGEPFWREALRVAKPGCHLLAFGGTRTFHRLMCAIEDAGWEIRDTLGWIYGSGFPKSHNLGNGFGTALKPAWEPIILARKPVEGTVAANVLKYGTGGMNIESCRVGVRSENESGWSKTGSKESDNRSMSGKNYTRDAKDEAGTGRWPANLLHDGSEEVTELFPVTQSGEIKQGTPYNHSNCKTMGAASGCITRDYPANSGSAARFFYCAKASREDRNDGLDGFEKKMLRWSSGEQSPGTFQSEGTDRYSSNYHPTVKPTALMRYLCRLVTPPGGVVLDPFMGSGSTGKAALLEGFHFLGIEREPEYIKIAQARLERAAQEIPLLAKVESI